MRLILFVLATLIATPAFAAWEGPCQTFGERFEAGLPLNHWQKVELDRCTFRRMASYPNRPYDGAKIRGAKSFARKVSLDRSVDGAYKREGMLYGVVCRERDDLQKYTSLYEYDHPNNNRRVKRALRKIIAERRCVDVGFGERQPYITMLKSSKDFIVPIIVFLDDVAYEGWTTRWNLELAIQ